MKGAKRRRTFGGGEDVKEFERQKLIGFFSVATDYVYWASSGRFAAFCLRSGGGERKGR